MTESFETASNELRKTEIGEVFEVIEGPRKESALEIQRIRGKASKDGKLGWTTLTDAAGKELFAPSKMLVCKTSIAITNSFDITGGKAMRKLEVGETLDIIDGPQEDTSRSLVRVKAKAHKDGKDGWVTMKGNQGTAYVEESTKHYKCTKSVDLEARFGSGSSPAIRVLEEGETFEVMEGPKPEIKQGAQRVRGRSMGDGTEGWFTLARRNMLSWSPNYTCKSPVDLFEDSESSKLLRQLESGESLEALEPPILNKESGVVRIRLRAERDSAVGFANVKDQSTVFLEIHSAKEAQ